MRTLESSLGVSYLRRIEEEPRAKCTLNDLTTGEHSLD